MEAVMGIKSERLFSRLGLFLSVVALSALGPTGVHSTAEQISAQQEYVLKVNDVTRASDLVESIGGKVSHSMPTLGYLGVELSKEQANLVSRSSLVTRISEGSNKLAGVWWHYAVPEVPSINSIEDETQVTGVWWHYAVPEVPVIDSTDSSHVAGVWWHYAVPDVPAIDNIDEESQVAGVWWHYAVPERPEVDEAESANFGGIAELQGGGELTVAGVWWHY